MATVALGSSTPNDSLAPIGRLVAWAGWGYPVLLLTVSVGSWLVAWMVLGHMPRPSIDDPKEVLGWGSYLEPLAIMAMPLGAFCALGHMVQLALTGTKRPWLAMALCLGLTLLWAGSFLFLQSDFQGMTTWLAD